MEDQSDRSSETSSLHQYSRPPSIHLQQFLIEEHAQGIANNEGARIFTVAETLKDPFILSHIKPDYGSLGQFMVDVSLRKDYLSQKKKKNQGVQQQNGDKKMRHQLKDKKPEELHDIFLNPQSSALEKKIASKLMVENIFKDTFSVPIQTFEIQNQRQQEHRNLKINLNDIDEIFREKKNNIERSSVFSMKKNKTQRRPGDQVGQHKVQKDKKMQTISKQQKYEVLNSLKNKFLSFKGVDLEASVKSLQNIDKQPNADQEDAKKKERTKNTHQPIILIKDNILIVQNISLSSDILLGVLLSQEFQTTNGFCLNQIRAKQEHLIFLLEAFVQFRVPLHKVQIKRISFEKMDGLMQKLRDILENCPVKELTLQYLGLDSKNFCELALGIAKNQTLNVLNLSNNQIDRTACRSLELITKHCSKLDHIILKNSFIEPHLLSHLPPHNRKKILL